MRPAAPVTAIGPAQRGEFIAPEMLAPGAPVPAAAEDADLVYKI